MFLKWKLGNFRFHIVNSTKLKAFLKVGKTVESFQFSSIKTGPIEVKFHIEVPWVERKSVHKIQVTWLAAIPQKY